MVRIDITGKTISEDTIEGSDVTWDFGDVDTLSTNYDDVFKWISASKSDWGDSFPDADIMLHRSSPTSHIPHNYCKKNQNGLWETGALDTIKSPADDRVFYYTKDSGQIPFIPILQYQDSIYYKASRKRWIAADTFYLIDFKGYVTADGWGKLTTPNDSNIKVLRIKTYKTGTKYKIDSGDTIFQFNISPFFNYRWYKNGVEGPVMIIGGRWRLAGRFIYYSKDITTSSTQQTIPFKNKLTVSPTLFDQQLNITYHLLNKKEVSISIYNIKGKRITKTNKTHNSPGEYEIIWQAPDQLSEGLYLLRFQFGNESYITKRVVKIK